MPQRTFVSPTRISPTGTGEPPILQCHFELRDIGDVLLDKRVRLVVYDKTLYRLSRVGRLDGNDLSTFRADAVLSSQADTLSNFGSPLDPPLMTGSGVLLSLDGFLQKTKDVGRWFIKPTDIRENADSLRSPITLQLVNEKNVFAAIANIRYRGDDISRINTDLVLVVRLILLEAAGRFAVGEVLASTLNKKHNPFLDPLERPNVVDWAAVSEMNPTVGDDGGRRTIPTARATSRVPARDLTGYYEVPVRDYRVADPPFIVHINHAGKVLCGWFSAPARMQGVAATHLPSGVPTQGGAFRAIDVAESSGPWAIEWWASATLNQNSADPDDGLDPDSKERKLLGFRRGSLEVVPGHPDDDFVQELRLILESDPTTHDAIVFPLTRRGLTARWPFRVIDKMVHGNFRDTLLATQVQPVASTALSRADDLLSERNPALVKAISDWMFATSSILFLTGRDETKVIGARVSASNEVARAIRGISKLDVLTMAKLRALAGSNDITVVQDDFGHILPVPVVQSCLTWLQQIVDDQIDVLEQQFPTKRDEELFPFIETPLRDFGLEPAGRFLYTFKFRSTGTTFTAGLGAYAFSFTIKKQVRKDDQTGRAILDVHGKEQFDSSKDSSTYDAKTFFGAYTEFGIGLKLDLKKMTSTTRGLKDDGPGAAPGVVAFRSCHDLRVDDFDDMSFTVSALKFATVSTPVASGEILDSAFLQFHLLNGVELDAVVENILDAKLKLPGLKTLFKIMQKFVTAVAKDPKHQADPKKLAEAIVDAFIPSVTILNVTTGAGRVLLNPDFVQPSSPQIEAKTGTSPERLKSRVTSSPLFDVDSAEIATRARYSLELSLAVDRALFTSAEGWIRATGFASPEATVDHNKKLTEARAFAVLQAVRDALGDKLLLNDIVAIGLGEEPSTLPVEKGGGGLLDPEKASATERDRLVREHVQWDFWRRVDLVAEGILVARVRGRGAKPD